MTCNHLRWGVLSLVAGLASAVSSPEQGAPAATDPAITTLAGRIGESLHKKKAKGIFVADLRGPDEQEHPVGKWLADQLSSALERDFPELQIIEKSEKSTVARGKDRPGDESNPLVFEKERDLARKLGASVVVAGSFAKVPQGIGISLFAISVSDSSHRFGETNGLIPITDEISALSPDPIPSPKNTIARAGTGGVTVPDCGYCPPPVYPSEARKAKLQGIVTLLVTVSADGHASHITVVKTPGKQLTESAIAGVRDWRFKPALGPDGKPVPAVVPIEVTFHFY